MSKNQIVDVVKTLKKTELVFDDGSTLTVGVSNIEIEPVAGGDELISIHPDIKEEQFRVLYSSATLNKQGTSSATELREFWESNNFFFDIGSQVIADGRVEFRDDLPITLTFPPVGAIYFVEQPTLILVFYKLHTSGDYIKDTDTGSLSDWRKTNKKSRFTTSEFRVLDNVDQSKQLAFDTSAFSTSTLITAIWRNLSGTISFLIEKFRDYSVGVSNPNHQEGRVFYDFDKHALSYYNENEDVTINIAQELVARVYNDTGVTIENGSAIRYGGMAISGVPTIVKSLADISANAVVAAVTTNEILDGEIGYVTFVGNVGGLDTSSFDIGDRLFLSSTVAGELTNQEQPITTLVAIVVFVDAVDGIIIVKPQEVVKPFAIGQSFENDSHVQSLTTTPVPLEGFTDTPFVDNMVITATASNGSFRAIISPLSVGFTGFYELYATLTMLSSANVIVVIEVYINGNPTGVLSKKDFSSNIVDEGTITLSGFTETQVDDTDEVEIYVYTSSGTTDITIENVLLNAKLLGTV